MAQGCSKEAVKEVVVEDIPKPIILDKEIVYIDQPSGYRSIPNDSNFRNVHNLPGLPSTIKVDYPWEKERLIGNNQGYITSNVFVDPNNEYILQLMLSTPGTPDTSTGSPQYKTRYRVSTDGGATFSEVKLLQIEGYTKDNPIKGVEIGRNGYNVNFTTPIIQAKSGKIVIPINLHPWDDVNKKIYNPANAYIFQDAGAIIGTWNSTSKSFTWEFGEWLRIDHNVSTRGLSEPSIVELKDGRFAMTARGSNLNRPDLPGYTWVSFSSDHCMTWSVPVPLTYSTGENFFVPASCSTIFRSRINGRLYWIGNLVNSNPESNYPRFPLVIGEVNEKNFGLIKETVLQIDTRNPDKEGEKMQLSNFKILEHNQRNEIIVVVTRLELSKAAKAPCWYQIQLT
ncbi:hypothetical protein GCM10025777_21300 [Membranihabitans marinus]